MGRALRTAVTTALAAAVAAGTLPASPASARSLQPLASCRAVAGDAVHRRTLAELDAWAAWLRAAGRPGRPAPGFVGELGWPDGGATRDGERWDCLAAAWYARADQAGLHATAWLVSERRGGTHALSVYESPSPGRPASRVSRQARVVERHGSTRGRLRGVNVSGAEDGFGSTGPSALTAQRPGTRGVTHQYPAAATYAFLAARGVRLVRLPARWERLQPSLGGPLARGELRPLLASVDAARAAGLTVVVDLHNYGGYWVDGPAGTARRLRLGDPRLPVARLTDVWLRLASALGRRDRVVLGLMNEPVALDAPGRDGARVWEVASAEVVRRLRGAGHRHVVAVSGYAWSSLARWPRVHPRPWVRDPLGRVWYEAHHYWDLDHSSTYEHGYDEQVRLLRGR